MKVLHWMGIGTGDADTRPRSAISGNRTPYTGEQLRAIRAVKGVGKRHVGNVDAWVRRCNQVNEMYARWMHARLLTWKSEPETGSFTLEGMERHGT